MGIKATAGGLRGSQGPTGKAELYRAAASLAMCLCLCVSVFVSVSVRQAESHDPKPSSARDLLSAKQGSPRLQGMPLSKTRLLLGSRGGLWWGPCLSPPS